jgi:hypothetical protein
MDRSKGGDILNCMFRESDGRSCMFIAIYQTYIEMHPLNMEQKEGMRYAKREGKKYLPFVACPTAIDYTQQSFSVSRSECFVVG